MHEKRHLSDIYVCRVFQIQANIGDSQTFTLFSNVLMYLFGIDIISCYRLSQTGLKDVGVTHLAEVLKAQGCRIQDLK